jgi:hypothetical protein
VVEGLNAVGGTDNALLEGHTEADPHNPSSPDAT